MSGSVVYDDWSVLLVDWNNLPGCPMFHSGIMLTTGAEHSYPTHHSVQRRKISDAGLRVEALVNSSSPDKIDRQQILHWLELTCWVVLALWPIMRGLNGRSVSRDQAIFRWAILGIAVAGSVGIRGYRMVRAWRLTASSD